MLHHIQRLRSRHFLKTRSTKHRSALLRCERNCCLYAALSAGCARLGMHSLRSTGAFCLAFLAAFWVVFELFFEEEKLLSGCENELGVAINARQNPIRKFHGLLSAASKIPECRVRVKFHGARMGVGKYVSGLTASQPRLYARKAATLGLFLLLRVQSTPQSSIGKRRYPSPDQVAQPAESSEELRCTRVQNTNRQRRSCHESASIQRCAVCLSVCHSDRT